MSHKISIYESTTQRAVQHGTQLFLISFDSLLLDSIKSRTRLTLMLAGFHPLRTGEKSAITRTLLEWKKIIIEEIHDDKDAPNIKYSIVSHRRTTERVDESKMIHIPAMQHLRKANTRRQRTGTGGKWEFSANILKKERSYATHKKCLNSHRFHSNVHGWLTQMAVGKFDVRFVVLKVFTWKTRCVLGPTTETFHKFPDFTLCCCLCCYDRSRRICDR